MEFAGIERLPGQRADRFFDLDSIHFNVGAPIPFSSCSQLPSPAANRFQNSIEDVRVQPDAMLDTDPCRPAGLIAAEISAEQRVTSILAGANIDYNTSSTGFETV